MKSGTTSCIKFMRLKRRLSIPAWQAVGVLESIWNFTCQNAPQGDIGKHTNEEIAAAIEWEKEPEELIQVLVDCGWLDASIEHRLLVHDWADHAPNYVKGGLAKSGKMFASYGKAKVEAKVPAKASVEAKPKKKFLTTKRAKKED